MALTESLSKGCCLAGGHPSVVRATRQVFTVNPEKKKLAETRERSDCGITGSPCSARPGTTVRGLQQKMVRATEDSPYGHWRPLSPVARSLCWSVPTSQHQLIHGWSPKQTSSAIIRFPGDGKEREKKPKTKEALGYILSDL